MILFCNRSLMRWGHFSVAYFASTTPQFDPSKNYYKILNLQNCASDKDIKKAYYELAKKYHPDHDPAMQSTFKSIKEAYEILSDEKLRKKYDSMLEYEIRSNRMNDYKYETGNMGEKNRRSREWWKQQYQDSMQQQSQNFDHSNFQRKQTREQQLEQMYNLYKEQQERNHTHKFKNAKHRNDSKKQRKQVEQTLLGIAKKLVIIGFVTIVFLEISARSRRKQRFYVDQFGNIHRGF